LKKLTIKKKRAAQGDVMHTGNYDILVDGEPIDDKRLINIKIEAGAFEYPTVSLEYRPKEIEIDGVVVNDSKGEAK
jgi:hypothetical protein